MADEKPDSTASLGSLFDGTPETSKSSESPDSSSEVKLESTDSKEDTSSSPDGAEKPPVEEKDKSSLDTDPPSKTPEEIAAEKAAADKVKDLPTDEKTKADAKKAADDKAAADLPFKQRLEETQKWAQGINQENTQLRQIAEDQKQRLDVLQKKVDGTWTEQDEAASQQGHRPEDIASYAKLQGKAIASHAAATRELGAETVNAALAEYYQLFDKNPAMRQALNQSDSPVHEAMAIIDRYHFEQEHGATPKEWIASITKKVSADLEKSLRKSILEEIRAGKSKRENTPESLANTGGGDQGENSKLREEAATSLQKIFDH